MRVNLPFQSEFKLALAKLFPNTDFPKFKGLTIDSRKVKSGDIFLPLKGEATDGHLFINNALDSGASLAISEIAGSKSQSVLQVPSTKQFLRDLVREYRSLLIYPIIGITGSNGKTTTKELLCHVLSSSMNVAATKGNFNSTVGVPLSLFEFDPKADIAVIEMGASKSGEIEAICNMAKPDMSLITNICEAHLENFGTIEQVAITKSAIFSALPKSGTAFINVDDPLISKMDIHCNRVTFAFDRDASFKGKCISGASSNAMAINDVPIKLLNSSSGFGKNVLAVFAMASHLGLDVQNIVSQIETFQTPEGRGDILQINEITVINDSYNSNLESARSGIVNLVNMAEDGRKIAVIGDMLELGAKEKEHHQLLGKYLSEKGVDAVFAFGDLTQHTIQAMNGTTIFHQYYADKIDLLGELKEFLQSGDFVYVKGSRGMRMEDVITGLKS